MDSVKKLMREAEKHGLTVVEKSNNGHYQITGGPLLVNYYPTAKKQTAYIAGMNGSYKHVSPEQAVQMALTQPERTGKKDKRSGREKNRVWKKQILKTHPYCHWCKTPLTLATATLEHIVPLDIGGLDNRNNMTVACEPCNRQRGNKMIELEAAK